MNGHTRLTIGLSLTMVAGIWAGVAQAQSTVACLAITGAPTAAIDVGTQIALGSECCGAPPAPSVPGVSTWLLMGLSLLLLAGSLRAWRQHQKLTTWLLVAMATALAAGASTRIATGQSACGTCAAACPTSLSWDATSANESFTGVGTTFNFTPLQAGTFTVTLTAGSTQDQTTIEIVLRSNGESCAVNQNDFCEQRCINDVCADPSATFGDCEEDDDCSGTRVACSSGECIRSLGASCSSDSQCQSGECSDGICCDQACDGQCERCSSSGTCGNSPSGTSCGFGSLFPCLVCNSAGACVSNCVSGACCELGCISGPFCP